MINYSSKLSILCMVLGVISFSDTNVSYCMEDGINNIQIEGNNNKNKEPRVNDFNEFKEKFDNCIQCFNQIQEDCGVCYNLFDIVMQKVEQSIAEEIKKIEEQTDQAQYIQDAYKSDVMLTLQKFKKFLKSNNSDVQGIKDTDLKLLQQEYDTLFSEQYSDNITDSYFDRHMNKVEVKINEFCTAVNEIVSILQKNACDLHNDLRSFVQNNKKTGQNDAAFWVCQSVKLFCFQEMSQFLQKIQEIKHMPFYNDNIFYYF